MLTCTQVQERVETGNLQIGEDWPGVFIRGDNALLAYAPALRALLDGQADIMDRSQCQSLLKLLSGCNQHEDGIVQVLPVHVSSPSTNGSSS